MTELTPTETQSLLEAKAADPQGYTKTLPLVEYEELRQLHDLVMRIDRGDPEWFVYDSIRCHICGGEHRYGPHRDERGREVEWFDHRETCPVPGLILYIEHHKGR